MLQRFLRSLMGLHKERKKLKETDTRKLFQIRRDKYKRIEEEKEISKDTEDKVGESTGETHGEVENSPGKPNEGREVGPEVVNGRKENM